MTIADVRAELEDELSCRLDEIRFYRNQLSEFVTEQDKERYCKCLIVMLYAHFEGFWKASFTIYLAYLNRQGIRCSDAVDHLFAASMGEVFHALSDSSQKCDFFRRNAPDDTKLHRFSRHVEFAHRISDVMNSTVDVPIDQLVDTESNLTPVVVRKILYRLGFPHNEFGGDEGTIQQLLRRRNDVAHGSARIGIKVSDYGSLESAIEDVMKRVISLIFESLCQRRYLKASSIGGAAPPIPDQ